MDYRAQPGLSPEARLALIEEMVGRLDQRLFGNGQPGELSAIKQRLRSLEQFKWQLAGAAGVLIAAVEYFHKK
jgi:hypothetical protein